MEHEISEGNVATAAAAALASAATKAKVCFTQTSLAWFPVHVRALLKMVLCARSVLLHVLISKILKELKCRLLLGLLSETA